MYQLSNNRVYLGFVKDAFVVVISQRTGELVVVHVRLAFPISPESCNFVWIFDDEFSGFSLKDKLTILQISDGGRK